MDIRKVLTNGYNTVRYGWIESYDGAICVDRVVYVGHQPGGNPHIVTSGGTIRCIELDQLPIVFINAQKALGLTNDEARLLPFFGWEREEVYYVPGYHFELQKEHNLNQIHILLAGNKIKSPDKLVKVSKTWQLY